MVALGTWVVDMLVIACPFVMTFSISTKSGVVSAVVLGEQGCLDPR
jgi:hypothetical protein